MNDDLIVRLRMAHTDAMQRGMGPTLWSSAADELEKAKELIRVARMCMNPANHADWFRRATDFLNDV
jgi:hypothetical protein